MSYNEQLRRRIVNRFYQETGKSEATTSEMARWAIKTRIVGATALRFVEAVC